MSYRAASAALVVGLLSVSALEAQIPRNSPRLGGPKPNAPIIMVANPFTTNAADSATAIALGNAIRDRLTRNVGSDYRVLTRQEMGNALTTYGYSPDALLRHRDAVTLAQRLTGRTLLGSTLTKEADGRYRLVARLVGTNEPAGQLITVVQAPGQKLTDMGSAVADAFRPSMRALTEARECVNNAATDPKKAAEAAQKSIKTVPNFGLAEFCLGELANARERGSEEALVHYQNAFRGDSASLDALTRIAVVYQVRNDSVKTVETFQQMLRVEPTNQVLREEAFKLFLGYNRPEAAQEVADQGITHDPENTDWYDLKSSACLYQEDFKCAVQQLVRVYEIDSMAVDSSFFKKITASAQFGEDTVAMLNWSRIGANRYPDNVELLGKLARSYAMTSQPDSAAAVVNRLLVIDPTKIDELLFVANALAASGNAMKVIEFVPAVQAADIDSKNTLGQILVNAASAARSAADSTSQLALAEAAIATGMDEPRLRAYAGFFVAERLYPVVASTSQTIANSKSCPAAQEYMAVLNRLVPALEMAVTSTEPAIKTTAEQMMGPVRGERDTRVPQLVAGFCN